MISRGAKATEEEAALIVDYLATNYGPAPGGGRGPTMAAAGGGRGPRLGPGPADKQVVDPAAADRGRRVYAAECITCHGTHARGTDRGADLVRSEVVLHDRYGSTIGPFLKKGHPTPSSPSTRLTAAQMEDLAHTLHQEVYNTLRAALEIQNVLTGDPKAGAAYFNGAGKCARATRRRATWRASARGRILRRSSSAFSSQAAGAGGRVAAAARPDR